MKRILYILLFAYSLAYSQEKKFSKFELLYDIPQQIEHYDKWPKYSLKSMELYNDTIFTLVIKKNHLTSIPLSDKKRSIHNEFISLPPKSIPLKIARKNGLWYFLLNTNEVGYLNDGQYTRLIEKPRIRYFSNLYFINDKIMVYDTNGSKGALEMFDFNGNLINSSKTGSFVLMNANIYKNELINIMNKIVIRNDSIIISDSYDFEKYGNDNVFVGSYNNYGYFVDWDNRDHIVIRDMNNLSKEEVCLKIPIKFRQDYMGISPEGEESINLRVLSEDNKTFYFVLFKHGHLLIYKAVR